MIDYPVIDDLILPEVVHELTMEEELEIMKIMRELYHESLMNEGKTIIDARNIFIR